MHTARPASRQHVLPATIAFVLAAMTINHAFAGEKSIEATPTTTSCSMDEVILIQVRIKNPTQASMPVAPADDAFTIRYSGGSPSTMQSTQIINGRMSQEVSYTYSFELIPLRPGTHKVGPFTWKDGPQTFRTSPFVIRVAKSKSRNKELFARIISDRDAVYVGEPVQLAIEVWVRKYRQADLGELDPNGTFARIDGGSSDFGVFADAAHSLPKYREDSLEDDAPPALRTRRRLSKSGEKEYLVFIWETTYTPEKPGKLDFGDIVIACNYPVRLRRSFFRVEDVRQPRRLRTRPEVPDIDVKSVPLQGRPASYNGAIGTFDLSTRAAPTSVPVGDPITLTLNLRSNDAPLAGLGAPQLNAVEDITKDFEISNESLAGEVRGNSKIFSQTIRPLREDVKEIPAIPFSYFDPATGKYETAWSDPIPLRVRPAERVVIANPDDNEPNPSGMAPLVETTDGLQANHADIDRLLANQTVRIGMGTYVFLGAMPTLFLLGAVATRRARHLEKNAGARRRSRALRDAKSQLSASANAGEILGAVLGYVANRFDMPAGSLTRREAADLLASNGASQIATQQLDELLAALEAAQYAGATGVDSTKSRSQALELLTRIDGEVKS